MGWQSLALPSAFQASVLPHQSPHGAKLLLQSLHGLPPAPGPCPHHGRSALSPVRLWLPVRWPRVGGKEAGSVVCGASGGVALLSTQVSQLLLSMREQPFLLQPHAHVCGTRRETGYGEKG